LPFTPVPYLSIAGLRLPTHGLFFLTAALVCLALLRTQLSVQEFRRLFNSLPWLTLGSLIGARTFYLVSRLESDVSLWPRFWEGGMVSYGGLAGCLTVLWVRHGSKEASDYFDRLAGPCLISWGVGRLGCLLNWYGEIGTLTDVPWGLEVGGLTRHPTTGYLAFLYIVGGLVIMNWRCGTPGRRSAVAAIFYGTVRGACDQWRAYEFEYLGQLSQAICVGIVLLGLILLRQKGSNPTTSVESEGREK
jgi:prolipoprotein diacylglyceryltransferase